MPSTSAEPILIPRETLFGNPERVSPRLSPDGKHLAYLAPDAGVLNVWIRPVGSADDRAVTRDRGRGIRFFFWAMNSDQILFVQDRDGDENWHLYAVDASGGEPRDLTPHDGIQARVIARDHRFPDEILVGINGRDPQLHDVHRLNTRTGESRLVARNDIGAIDWRADRDLRVRLGQVPREDGGFALMHRADEDSPWDEVVSWGSEDAWSTGMIGFREDGETVFVVSSVGTNTAELRTLNLRSKEQELLARHDAADASDTLVDPRTHEVQAVAFQVDHKEWTVLDDVIRDDFARLGDLHEGDFSVVSRDHADRTWLVSYVQDRGPVVYYTFDRTSKRGVFLFSHRPELEEVPLSEMRCVRYEARDGMTLHAFLTLPPDHGSRRLPAVVNVHGGPWHRDTWGYHPEAQWLANRGYACLQINFRGSTGYGKAYINAGDREWGGKMQNDISDGVRWLIDQGIADPARVAIYGGSYGGFAVLSGMTTTPDLYACGVDLVGPSNLMTFIRTIPPYWKPLQTIFKKRVGDVDTEEDFLKSRSPLFHVDAIRAPLLIAQGANDPRVKREESLQIVEELKKRNKVVEYIEFADEGHGFARPENRLVFYAAAEKFLSEHLGGRFEP